MAPPGESRGRTSGHAAASSPSLPSWLLRWPNSLVADRPLDLNTLLFHWAPIHGSISYHALALTVINPKLARNMAASVGIPFDLTNYYLLTAISGFSLKIYAKTDEEKLSRTERTIYSCYMSSLSVLGSVLVWALMAKRLLPMNPLLRIIGALGSASLMFRTKRNILKCLRISK